MPIVRFVVLLVWVLTMFRLYPTAGNTPVPSTVSGEKYECNNNKQLGCAD